MSRERPIPFSGRLVRAILADQKSVTRRVIEKIDAYKNVRAGDRLWVKETFLHFPAEFECTVSTSVPRSPARTVYRATEDPEERQVGIGWRPPRFMPRELSRILLEVTEDPHVERIQEITDAEAIAEGVEQESWPEDVTADDNTLSAECGYFPPRSHVAAFARLWDSINATRGYGWDTNPRVRVIRFRRLP